MPTCLLSCLLRLLVLLLLALTDMPTCLLSCLLRLLVLLLLALLGTLGHALHECSSCLTGYLLARLLRLPDDGAEDLLAVGALHREGHALTLQATPASSCQPLVGQRGILRECQRHIGSSHGCRSLAHGQLATILVLRREPRRRVMVVCRL
jgi:hypothetical protein